MTILIENCANLDLRSLPSVSFVERKYLPCSSGIYLVIRKNEVLYIGKSANIRDRWKSHHQSSLVEEFDRIAWWELPKESLNEAELRLIERFNPCLNINKISVTLPPLQKAYYPLNELMERYGLSSRQALYDRINSLQINTKNNGKRGILSRDDVQQLDQLHKSIVERYSISQSEIRERVSKIKKSLQLLKQYYEGNLAMPLSQVASVIEEAISQADQLK